MTRGRKAGTKFPNGYKKKEKQAVEEKETEPVNTSLCASANPGE